jgi:hypothetical protein
MEHSPSTAEQAPQIEPRPGVVLALNLFGWINIVIGAITALVGLYWILQGPPELTSGLLYTGIGLGCICSGAVICALAVAVEKLFFIELHLRPKA